MTLERGYKWSVNNPNKSEQSKTDLKKSISLLFIFVPGIAATAAAECSVFQMALEHGDRMRKQNGKEFNSTLNINRIYKTYLLSKPL